MNRVRERVTSAIDCATGQLSGANQFQQILSVQVMGREGKTSGALDYLVCLCERLGNPGFL